MKKQGLCIYSHILYLSMMLNSGVYVLKKTLWINDWMIFRILHVISSSNKNDSLLLFNKILKILCYKVMINKCFPSLLTNVGGHNVYLNVHKWVCVCTRMCVRACTSKYPLFNSQRGICYWDQFVICIPFTDYHFSRVAFSLFLVFVSLCK